MRKAITAIIILFAAIGIAYLLMTKTGTVEEVQDKEQIQTLLNKNDPVIGPKTLALIAAIYIDKKSPAEAQSIIHTSDELANSVHGQELLARIAYLQGETAKAEEIYNGILENSSEAKSYFARKAYIENDLPKARELTEELLLDYPDNATIRNNLKKIINKQKAL